jgi:hypothetical protein
MKAIINGKRYDTSKATLIGETSSPGYVSVNDFSYWEAGLYKTPRSGTYFLAGQGGPMTRWSRSAGNMQTGGSGIIPLDADEALEWAERYLATSEVEAGFGAVVEDA